MPSKWHEETIERICKERGASRIGFNRALRRVGAAPNREAGGITPDAFLVDEPARTVMAFEVVDRHPPNMQRYIDLWWEVDTEGWFLILEIHYRGGGIEVDHLGDDPERTPEWLAEVAQRRAESIAKARLPAPEIKRDVCAVFDCQRAAGKTGLCTVHAGICTEVGT